MLISADKSGNADAFIVRYQPCPKFLLTVQRNALVQYVPAGRFIVRDLFRKHICFLRFRLYRLPYTYSFADNQTIIRGQITFNHDTSLLVGFLYQFFVSCHLLTFHPCFAIFKSWTRSIRSFFMRMNPLRPNGLKVNLFPYSRMSFGNCVNCSAQTQSIRREL